MPTDLDVYRDYAKDEKLETFERDGKTWGRVTGRKRIPDDVKNRLCFMFKLDGKEQWLDDGSTDWWAPGWPQWIRVVSWYARNPFASRFISTVVLGVQDRNYEVEVTEGRFDLPFVTQRDDITPPEMGWQKCTLHLDDGTKKYWRCYVGKWVTFYYGCQPSGLFALKWNFPKHSAFA